MKYILSTLLFSFLLISCASSKEGSHSAASSDNTEFKNLEKGDSLFAYIRRSPCYGTCPTYEMKIYNSGFVELSGGRFIDLLGEHTTTIARAKMRAFIEKATSIGYMKMDDVYDNTNITDLPATSTSIVINDVRKSIRRRVNYPNEILAFEKLFDDLLTSEKWKMISEPEVEPQKK
ncbi:MAG: DUF6438 domain-containing protein [Crocinitomicaceae bacterium]